MEPVDVLRALALGKLGLRPGEVQFLGELARRAPLASEPCGPVRRRRPRSYVRGTRSTLRPLTPTASNSTSSVDSSGWRASQSTAAACTRRAFSSSIISSGCAEAVAALLLHLGDDDAPAPTHDEIELVAPGACVRLEQAVAPQAVMEESPALSPVHAANGAAITSATTSSGAGSSSPRRSTRPGTSGGGGRDGPNARTASVCAGVM